MATSAPDAWTCPSCKAVVTTPFCPTCGERLLHRRDLSLRSLFDQAFHALTNVDGRVFRTARSLLFHPGSLAVAYLHGPRKRYIAPFQVFLLANVVFFAVQSISATNIFGSTLASHLHLQDWQATARALTAARLQHAHLTLDRYAPVFDRAVENNAKTLVILMTVPFALLLAAFFHRRERPFAVHAVLALHVLSFLLIVFSASLLIADLDTLLGGAGLRSAGVDNALSTFNVLACAAYLFFAVHRVYHASGWMRVLKTFALSLALLAIVLGYRFLLFLITLYATT